MANSMVNNMGYNENLDHRGHLFFWVWAKLVLELLTQYVVGNRGRFRFFRVNFPGGILLFVSPVISKLSLLLKCDKARPDPIFSFS